MSPDLKLEELYTKLYKIFRKWCQWECKIKTLKILLLACYVASVVSDSVQDGSPPGSPGPGILQARTLEWVAISFSNSWYWKVKVKTFGCIRLLATPWTAAYQAPPSMGFSRQEYWSGLPLLSPKDSLSDHQSPFSPKGLTSRSPLFAFWLNSSFVKFNKFK